MNMMKAENLSSLDWFRDYGDVLMKLLSVFWDGCNFRRSSTFSIPYHMHILMGTFDMFKHAYTVNKENGKLF